MPIDFMGTRYDNKLNSCYYMEYSIVPTIALLVLAITNWPVFVKGKIRVTNLPALKAYRIFVLITAGFYVCDLLWGYLDPLPDKIHVFIDTSLYFVFMSLIIFGWTFFVTKFISHAKAFNILMRVFGLLFLLTGIILVIINIFDPILFTYDINEYAPKLGRLGFLLAQIAIFIGIGLYSLVAFLLEKDRIKRNRYFTLTASSLLFVAGVGFQLFLPTQPMYSFGLMLSTIVVHVFILSSQRISFEEELSASEEREQIQSRELENAKELAYIDALTGVKNKHAFVEVEKKYDELIREKKIEEFSLLVFDLNDLKVVNDTQGHDAGDIYLKNSCELIKEFFPNSYIYRYGGDEFVVIVEGEDYKNRYTLIDAFNKHVDENRDNDHLVVAAGISDFIPGKDNTLRSIFSRADDRMYTRKRRLKEESVSTEDLGNKITGASIESLRYEMYSMFYYNTGISLSDVLNGSNSDEIVEVDIANDSYKQLYHLDGKYFVPSVGPSYRELLDFTKKYVVHPDDVGVYMGLMDPEGFFDRLKNSKIPNFDFAHFRYKLQNGEYRWVEQVVICGPEFSIPDGMFRMYIIDINNIKNRQFGNLSDDTANLFSKEKTIKLYSSREFLLKANELVVENPNKNWCLLSLDIEHFKLFDEWFGREKGNDLLVQIGDILKEFERKYGGIAGYLGQDDFAVLCEHNMPRIQKLYNQIHTLINSYGMSAGFLPAFGIAVMEKDMVVVDALDKASIATSNAKGDIKHRIVTYDYEEQFKSEHELRILTQFMQALQSNEIQFYLQPQVRIPSGKIVGAEALTRWIKDDGTRIEPAAFIPILEKYGFITDLDKYIWAKVCKWIGNRLKNNKKVVPISVNVSRIDIFNIDIIEFFTRLCEKYNIPHELIKIEITESVYAENVAFVDELVNKLRAEGFMVLMDDFGSGYSSLNMLSTLKISAIKLDALFLQIEEKEYRKGINLLESVINLAKTMSLPIIVEGVEKKNQVDFLHNCGVDFVQGFYYYKPIPAHDFEKIIEDKKNLDNRGFTININEPFRLRELLDQNVYSDSMLNNILGSVAIYSVTDEHIEIVRFNQQFKDTVNVPDFMDKIQYVEKTMPKEDIPLAMEAFKEAKNNRLTGSNVTLRFHTIHGILTSYRMHFYYLGVKEGTDRFYGSVANITELVDLSEGKELVAKYSKDNIILIGGKAKGKWHYNVCSHALSSLIGLSPKELEEELNNGKFFRRVSEQTGVRGWMKEVEEADKENPKIHELVVTINNTKKQKVKIRLMVEYCGDQSNNYQYILRTEEVSKK